MIQRLLVNSCLLVFVFGLARIGVAQEATKALSEEYRAAADQLIELGRRDNQVYLKLQELCDDIGHRLSGSASLEQAIDWAQQALKKDGAENVVAEKVTVRKWVRGNEHCRMVSPREVEIGMLGLGGSVGTPKEGIRAEVLVVRDKDSLDEIPDEQVAGKIVVFNYPMPAWTPTGGSGYGSAVQYRGNGARWAAERGAVAALVRSCTAYSLNTPHTGAMRYTGAPQVKKIPTAAITIEGATLLARLQARGKKPVVELFMDAKDEGEVPSANVLGEIVGSEKPEEIVVIGGHIDSWDVGAGAQDDGCGCVAAMEALRLIKLAGLKPRRTIRVVLWTNEENGVAGANSYAVRHQNEKHVAGIESDSGGFKPQGLSIDMQDDDKERRAVDQLNEILSLVKSVGPMRVSQGFSGVDVGRLKEMGTACMGLQVDGRLYFNTHHTWADTVDKVDRKELEECAVTMAVAAFVVADMPGLLGDE